MVIPNMIMKFQNVDIFDNFCDIFELSYAHAFRLQSIMIEKSYVRIDMRYLGAMCNYHVRD